MIFNILSASGTFQSFLDFKDSRNCIHEGVCLHVSWWLLLCHTCLRLVLIFTFLGLSHPAFKYIYIISVIRTMQIFVLTTFPVGFKNDVVFAFYWIVKDRLCFMKNLVCQIYLEEILKSEIVSKQLVWNHMISYMFFIFLCCWILHKFTFCIVISTILGFSVSFTSSS